MIRLFSFILVMAPTLIYCQVSNTQEYTLIKPQQEIINYFQADLRTYEHNKLENSVSLIWMYNDSIMIENCKLSKELILYQAEKQDTLINGIKNYQFQLKSGNSIYLNFQTDIDNDLVYINLYSNEEYEYRFTVAR